MWSEFSAELQTSRRVSLAFSQDVRHKDRLQEWRSVNTELEFKYKIFKSFKVSATYRFTVRHRNLNENRITLNAFYKHQISNSKWDVTYRFRFQKEKKIERSSEASEIRNRFGIKHNFNKLAKPYASLELNNNFQKEFVFTRWRTTFGLETRIHQKLKLATYFRIQGDIKNDDKIGDEPDRAEIIGFSLKYSVN